MKTFSKFEVANIKRTAQSVYPLVKRKHRLIREMEEKQIEFDQIQAEIDGYQYPISKITGGYTTEDLVNRVVVDTGKKDKDGNPIKVTKYELKYPETIVPPVHEYSSEVASDVNEAPVERLIEAPIDEPFNI